MSKITVTLPDLLPTDLVKINHYAQILRDRGDEVIVDINVEKRRYILKKNGVIGFIQKKNQFLFIHYKNNVIDKIDKIVKISQLLKQYNVFPDDETFNFNGIINILNDKGR